MLPSLGVETETWGTYPLMLDSPSQSEPSDYSGRWSDLSNPFLQSDRAVPPWM